MKHLLLPLVVVALLIGGFVLWARPRSSTPSSKGSSFTEPVNQIDLKDRPYVSLAPTLGSRHPQGKEVTLTISRTALDSTAVEYELEYQAGSLIQGVFGRIDFTKDKPPVSKNLLLGSCSAGGKCSYHENVTGGSLTLRWRGGKENFALKGEWNLEQMGERRGKFSSRDAKFQLEVPSAGLPGSALLIIIQTMGLPGEVAGQVVAGPYAVFTLGSKLAGSAQLSLRLNQEASSVQLLGWNGTAWHEYKAQVSGKTLTAAVDRLTTFVAVSAP